MIAITTIGLAIWKNREESSDEDHQPDNNQTQPQTINTEDKTKTGNKPKLVKTTVFNKDDDDKFVQALFVDEHIVCYRCGEKLFKYDIKSDTTEEVKIAQHGIKFMKFAPSWHKGGKKRFDLLVSNLARAAGADAPPKELSGVIADFASQNVLILTDKNQSIATYNSALKQVTVENKLKTKHPIFLMCTSPNGELLAAMDEDRNMYIYNLFTKKIKRTLLADDKSVTSAELKQLNKFNQLRPFISISFHPNGKSLLIGGCISRKYFKEEGDNPMMLWDFSNRDGLGLTKLFGWHSEWLDYLAYYDEGKFCITVESERISTWDVEKKQPVKTLDLSIHDMVDTAEICPNKKFLSAITNLGIKIWHLPTLELVFDYKIQKVRDLGFSPSGDYMIIEKEVIDQGHTELLIFSGINTMLDDWLKKHG
ncbi:MAG: WD40 repeat domain-containing protein [Bacteroidota bacterium]